MKQPKHNFQDIFTLFFNPGEVCEIRAYGCGGKGPWDGWAKGAGIVFGYFNDPEAFAAAAAALEKKQTPGIYFTINPVMPDFLGRANNRLRAATNKTKTTADANIQTIRWLPIDLDPIRSGGGTDLNTSQEEFDRAWRLRNRIHEDIRKERTAQKGISAISGNGAHLLFRLPDLPPGEETTTKIRTALHGAAARWADPFVDIDLKVYNPARIWKLYGTTARKSDHTEQRPQRVSRIQFSGDHLPILADIPVNDRILDVLAAHAPKEKPKKQPPNVVPMQRPKPTRRQTDSDLGSLDLPKYLAHHGISYQQKAGTEKGYTLYVLSTCLFDPDHGRDAAISQSSDGQLYYQCFHNGCHGRTWHDARAAISGAANLAPFMTGYDPTRTTTRQPEPPPYGAAPRPTATTGAAAAVAYQTEELPFLYKNDKGRPALNPALAADYFESLLEPVYCCGEENQFWKYTAAGVWRPYSIGKIKRTVHQVLGQYSKPAWINQIVDMLTAQTYKDYDEIKTDPMYLNLVNGMWGIKERELLPHDHTYNSKVQFPISYNEDADCDPWIEAIAKIFADDPLKLDTLQDFFGYCLFPKILFPGVIFAIGDGGNGKGVVDHVLTKLLGPNAICHIGIERMAGRFGLSELKDKYINTESETSPDRVDVTGFKKASAGDEIQCERKGIGDIRFRPYAKHFISMNQFPHINERTNSFFRRITVLEFKQNFEGKECNPYLKDELEAVLDGVFLWALDGLYRVLENKCFTTPESVVMGKDKLKTQVDPVLSFVQDECILAENATIRKTALYDAFRIWCGNNRHMKRSKFYASILDSFKVITFRPSASTTQQFKGIGLLNDKHDECPQ